jgi:hypothetical protein
LQSLCFVFSVFIYRKVSFFALCILLQDATVPADKEMILAMVRSAPGGAEKLDAQIATAMEVVRKAMSRVRALR